MKRVVILLSLWAAVSVGAAADRGLLRSRNPNRTTPLWVPLSVAKTSDGRLAEEHFDAHARRRLLKYSERIGVHDAAKPHPSQRTCFGERPAEIHAPAATLEDLATNSLAIVSGQIIERTLGFFEDQPAAVLTVRVDRVLRSDAAFLPQNDELLLFYPDADFSIAGVEYCTQPATHPARPRVGDRVLAFAFLPPADSTARLMYTQSSKHLVFETAKGEFLVPAQLRQEIAAEGITSLDALMERIERLQVIQRETRGERR